MLHTMATEIANKLNARILNQTEFTELALTAFFAGGDLIVEGMPGIGKTIWMRSLEQLTGATCSILDFRTETLKQGFHVKNSNTFMMTILNAMEFETTDSIPLSLTDQFMMKLDIGYPGVTAEKEMLKLYHFGPDPSDASTLDPVCTIHELKQMREEIKSISVEEPIFNYIVKIVETTRRISAAQYGSSPRGSVMLLSAAKTYAALQGRSYVTYDDVNKLAVPVLRHRFTLKPEAEQEGITTTQVIKGILAQIKPTLHAENI